jgi:hypothetical protein
MEFIININLFILATGIFLMSLALHFKKENKNLGFGWQFGFAENLTTRGKVYFFIGVALTAFGAGIGINY